VTGPSGGDARALDSTQKEGLARDAEWFELFELDAAALPPMPVDHGAAIVDAQPSLSPPHPVGAFPARAKALTKVQAHATPAQTAGNSNHNVVEAASDFQQVVRS
jgi:hypothetical protein